MLPVEVVEVESGAPLGSRGDRHDPARDVLKEQVGQGEEAQEVGAELRLEPVGGASQRRRRDARVVDQQIDRAVPAGGERTYGVQVGEVKFAYLGHAWCGG